MSHIVIPRLTGVSVVWAVAVFLLHLTLCHPATTARGYPPIHPFWEVAAPYLAYLACILYPFFDDKLPTRRCIRNVLVPAMCFVNGMVYVNLSSGTPSLGSYLGATRLAVMNFPFVVLSAVPFAVVAYPTMYLLELAVTKLCSKIRAFTDGVSVTKVRFSLPALLGATVVVAAACWVGTRAPSVYDAWPGAHWDFACRNNLRHIGLAMHHYHDIHGSFPPAYLTDDSGEPAHSWRVLLLPYLGQEAVYARYKFDEPWDGPNNRQLIAQMPEVFSCRWDPGRDDHTTSYLVVNTPGGIFDGAASMNMASIVDGMSNTILVVERSDAAVPWTAPRDLSLKDAIRCNHGNTAWDSARVLLANGFTPWIDPAEGQVPALVSAAGGEPVEHK